MADVVSMDREFGIFITMNPGYAGRQELPENLKILFRSVAMMVPDRQIIIRVKLASCGFKENVILARKFYTLYKLCEEQLSKQVHYDFGLRNTISVLRTLGTQKRANPKDTEEKIVMRVLRDMNLSKLIDEDAPLFLSLIDDLFPGNKLSSSSYKILQSAIEKSAQSLNLMNEKDWNLKVVQLYETSLVRHGIMTLGPTGSGKTTAITTLLRSFRDLGQPHKEVRMNPKAITAAQMFGRLDVATNDWMDGIFSTLWRRSHKVKKSEYMWLILDGPVDAVWIENLNSVLDDNKTLTLANGDRIVMAENCKLVFEPDNVDNASPATVSRVGIIYLSSSVLKWMPILDTWLKGRSPQESQTLKTCFYEIYEDALVFVYAKLSSKMMVLEAIYIRQTIDILNGLLATAKSAKPAHLEKLFIFALMWSLGALLELDDRIQLEMFIATHKAKFDLPKKPENDTIFEFFVAPTGEWRHWASQVDEFIYPDDSIIEYASILVPNIDNIRTAYLIKLVADQRKPVLLIGEQGTAKTVMIKKFMATYNAEEHLIKTCNFSSATTPNMFQQIIESYVEKRVGLTYGPPGQRRMTVFVDDVNMPIINEWGDQITNEIFRQLIEQKGFYSLERPGDFMTVMDLQFLAAMIHPGGGRNDIPNRLKRKFCIFNCTMPSDPSMDKIFSAIARGYFSFSRFSETIVYFVPKLIELTRILWQRTKTKMLPTPAKFHYVFNLRDLSRIWEGILKIRQEECETVEMMLKLWRHECLRTIADRFVSSNEKKWFDTMMVELVQEHLESHVEQYDDVETYFVDFLRDIPEMTGGEGDDALETPKIYEEISSLDSVKEKVVSLMKNFNEMNRGLQLDLVFFHDCLVHLIIISRIIRTPRGNALLVGVGGSGKQSLTRLASFIAGYKFHQITLTRSYNINNFADDLKYLYRTAGVEGKGISFIFTDNDIKDDAFLEYINNVLSSGELPNLFTKEETDEIINDLDPVLRKQDPKVNRTRDALYDFFIQRCRSNLHVVLCFSPIGQKFRTRALKFPGLISGCTIDWFQPWPEDARIAVSYHYLHDYPMECTDQARDEVIKAMSFIHQNVSETCDEYYRRFRRQIFVTPKTLLTHLDSYKEMYVEKYENIQMLSKRMESGLIKLEEGGEAVKVLKVELIEQNKKMIVASEQAMLVYADVKVVADDAEVVKTEVAKVKNGAQGIVRQITQDTAVVEKKLAKAKPALDEAQAALNTITSTDIATVRRLGKPPYLITLIMDAVLILFGDPIGQVKPDPATKFLIPSWSDSMKTMSDTGFLNHIVKYPTDQMTDEMVDLLVPYFNNKLYTFEAAEAACGNVAGLLKWTIAMTKYFAVNKDVIPVKYKMAIQQHKLKVAEDDLHKAEELLADKEKVLAEAMKVMKVENDKKDAVFAVAKKCQDKMNSATALIDGLSSEKTRWIEQIAQFKITVDCLVGDILYLTAFLSYIGPFNQDYRKRLLETWRDYMYGKRIPMSLKINVVENLCDMATVGEWNVQGLPKDELSIQNGVIVAKASRYPLIIDPQCQGKVWIANMEREAGLIITTLGDRFFRNHVEDCISLGKPLLIEDVGEELDTCLDNILEKNFIRLGKTLKVKLSDKEIEYNSDFRLYITTKLANPTYSPEICARTSLIDFAVTMQGLEDQLLGRAIMHDKRELEEERTNIIITMSTNRRKIQQLEENLLKQLSMSTGNLLDDIPFINTLNASKATANDMKEKLITARNTEIEINAAREDFRVVATRGSVLYFLVCAMAEVNIMYQTSLNQFLERFDVSLSQSKKSHNSKIRIANIIEHLTFEIFSYKSRGLFENHKFLFSLLLALKIDMQKGDVSYEEFQTFMKGGAALNLKDCPKKPFAWITDMTWLNLVQLTVLRPFVNILKRIGENENQWKRWFQKAQPENATIPDEYQKLDVFRKLLLIRAWCPDRTYSQSRKYIAWSLGDRFIEPLPLNYNSMVQESRPLTPLICFLSMGSDPTLSIQSMAKRYDTTVKAISMGQGQEVHARALLSTCLLSGGWTLLQNCHLGLDYMDELVVQLKSLETDDQVQIHDKFRLWITTEVHPNFPITLLQQSIKFTNDPPSGVRAGLERTYGSMSQDFLDYSDSPYYLPLIYAVSFMHTVVQERRKFGPLGWNIPYEFNSSDWLASCMFMQNHLDEIYPKREICWNTIRYMLGEIQYGGRVTDDYDKRLLNTFAKVWFSSKLFTDDFQFCADVPKYKIHSFKLQEEYLQAFSEMETIDEPQVYGLHPNGDIAYQTSTTNIVLDTILSIEPKDSSGSDGESRESLVARLAKDMLEKLPPTYDPFEMRERLREMGPFNPMVIFLRQELDRMRVVLKFTRTTLSELLLAIEGTIIMNEELQNAFDSIFDAKVPRSWVRKSWESSTLGFWFTELIDRNKQFSLWLFKARPKSFCMSGFFNPQGFLTAVRQETTRANADWALDEVTLQNEVTKMFENECKIPPKTGVYVHGLYLDGGSWDLKKGVLTEAVNKVLYKMIPVINIFAVNATVPLAPTMYECPVYKIVKRTNLNFITSLRLKSDKPSTLWIQRGVALLCDIK
ncbi:hypothetical protein HA402_008600 [Bradysia odoriphaga]|nr:hypothetical protein HA402_008600 [Bradysia odoriphaga]